MLIDAIDAGMHHSVLKPVFTALERAARASDVQVFATTHSYECIKAGMRPSWPTGHTISVFTGSIASRDQGGDVRPGFARGGTRPVLGGPLMRTTAQNFTRPRILLRGLDEVNFFNALLAQLGVNDIDVIDTGGKTNLSVVIAALVRSPHFPNIQSLGITRDADHDAAGVFQSVCLCLKPTTSPGRRSRASWSRGRLVSVCSILPGNQDPGMLEDLCLSSIRADPAYSCLDNFFQCVGQKAARQPGNMAKGRLMPGWRRKTFQTKGWVRPPRAGTGPGAIIPSMGSSSSSRISRAAFQGFSSRRPALRYPQSRWVPSRSGLDVRAHSK